MPRDQSRTGRFNRGCEDGGKDGYISVHTTSEGEGAGGSQTAQVVGGLVYVCILHTETKREEKLLRIKKQNNCAPSCRGLTITRQMTNAAGQEEFMKKKKKKKEVQVTFPSAIMANSSTAFGAGSIRILSR